VKDGPWPVVADERLDETAGIGTADDTAAGGARQLGGSGAGFARWGLTGSLTWSAKSG